MPQLTSALCLAIGLGVSGTALAAEIETQPETDAEVPAAALLETVREAAASRLERVEVFDVFRGGPLGEGRKSLAIRLTFRDPERTLTDEDLVPVRARITEGVAAALGGRLRGG